MIDKTYAENLYSNSSKLKVLKHHHKEVYDSVVQQTSFLPEHFKIKPRLWHIMNGINHIITCKMCSNPVNWDDTTKEQKYRTYCSHKCMHNDPEIRAKKNEIELEKYGVGRKSVVEKMKATNKKRYGVTNPMQLESSKQKRNQTCLEKYGVDNPIKSKKIKEKRTQTNINRFGNEHPSRSEYCKNKTIHTIMEKYGKHQSHRHLSDDQLRKIKDKEWLEEQHITNKRTATDIADELGVMVSAITKKIRSFGIPFKHHVGFQSMQEKQLGSFLEELGIDFEESDRSLIPPHELDIYIPSHNLAIELNGIYWHSELNGKDRKYHLNKLKACQEKNIRLIHILETELAFRPEIVKSRIQSILGENQRIFARNTQVVNVTRETRRSFFNKTHIQGDVNATVCIGLMYNNELVSVMSFGKSRYSKKYEYEMLRFANKMGVTVVGGAGKIFKHFVNMKNPASVISYSDKRWNTGTVYEKLGFDFKHSSAPNYFYFHRSNTLMLYPRIKFQKHKLKSQLETFDPQLTEWQNMVNNQYDRIWDCGNDVFVWTSHTTF